MVFKLVATYKNPHNEIPLLATNLVKEFPIESEQYLYGLDLWIVDCVRFEPHYSHSHFEQTISWINKYKPKKAILTHLGAWLDYEKLLKLCPDNVFPAYDGFSINLT